MAPMTAASRRPRVAILNNEILPYRIPLFQAIRDQSACELMVFYSTSRSWERTWTIDPTQLKFPHRILPGFHIRLPKKNYLEKRTIYFHPTLFWELWRWKPDEVIGYEYSMPALTALLYARIARVPYLVFSECTAYSDRALSKGQRWIRRLVIPRAQGYLGTSRAACKNLIALGAPSERVFEAPQVQRVAWFAERAEAAHQAGATPEHRILYVGSLIERKGVDLLLDAFCLVAKQNPLAQLRIVGIGPCKARIIERADQAGLLNRISFADFIEPDRIPEEYARATIFILPTLEDTFGVVVVEALASGVPVLCSPFAGASDYLVDGESGFIVDPHQTDLLAERMQRLLIDSNLRIAFSARGREVAKRFEASSVSLIFLQAISFVRPG
jgi:glycosyltransferase involved in cell wall biosynthesis